MAAQQSNVAGAARRPERQRGFTVLELTVIVVLLSIITVSLIPRVFDLDDEGRDAHVDSVLAALQTGHAQLAVPWQLAGMPGRGTTALQNVTVDNIVVQYRNGQPQTTTNSNHIPATVPNRNTTQARLFFLFLKPVPNPIIATTSTGTGWVMLGTNNTCASTALVGANPRNCWEYRVNGTRYARISYSVVTGRFVRD